MQCDNIELAVSVSLAVDREFQGEGLSSCALEDELTDVDFFATDKHWPACLPLGRQRQLVNLQVVKISSCDAAPGLIDSKTAESVSDDEVSQTLFDPGPDNVAGAPTFGSQLPA